MENLKTVGIIIAVVLSGYAVVNSGEQGPVGPQGPRGENTGGVAGPVHTEIQEFRAGFEHGGRYVTKQIDGASTLSAGELVSSSGLTRYLNVTPTVSATLTLPATTTLRNFIRSAGECHVVKVENSATSTFNLTIGAGAGMDLQEPDGQNVVIGQNNFADLEFCRDGSDDIVVKVDETIPAD